jgi:hypothetical protein
MIILFNVMSNDLTLLSFFKNTGSLALAIFPDKLIIWISKAEK